MNCRLLHDQNWECLARKANFRPEAMAALCPISLRQLERFFKSRFNKTPTEWIREFRFGLAIKLISSGWSSKAVAAELHYWDESHFCHEFKRVSGASPLRFAPLYGNNYEPVTQRNVRLLHDLRYKALQPAR